MRPHMTAKKRRDNSSELNSGSINKKDHADAQPLGVLKLIWGPPSSEPYERSV